MNADSIKQNEACYAGEAGFVDDAEVEANIWDRDAGRCFDRIVIIEDAVNWKALPSGCQVVGWCNAIEAVAVSYIELSASRTYIIARPLAEELPFCAARVSNAAASL